MGVLLGWLLLPVLAITAVFVMLGECGKWLLGWLEREATRQGW